MPQQQLNALIAVAHRLPEIAKQLKIANELKALELRLKFHGDIEPIPSWVPAMEKLIKSGD